MARDNLFKVKNRITTLEMEIVVANHFNPRVNLIVPNIHWGFGIHECDLLVITPAGYASEIEIKVSKQDLKADSLKAHNHSDHRVKSLFFAIPWYLENCVDLIPEKAGIIVVDSNHWPKRIRSAKKNGKYVFSQDEKFQIARLGALRIWDLKRTVRDNVSKY